MNLGHLLFGFSGRINRGKYWLAVLIYVVVSVIMAGLELSLGSESIALSLLRAIVGIGTFISSIAVGIKRLHDRDKSGWWLLVFYVVPGILATVGMGLLFYGMADDSTTSVGVAAVLFLAASAISIWVFVELGCLRGTIGPNKYGPDPLAAPATVSAR